MKAYKNIFAVREKKTKKLISKRNSNPFFTRRRNAENKIKDIESRRWGYNKGELEVVMFEIKEVKDE